jgi:arsenite transporter
MTAIQPAADPPAISFFERYLTVWVTLCIVVGVAAGQLAPELFRTIGHLEVARLTCRSAC